MLFIEAEHAVIHSCALTFMKHVTLWHYSTAAKPYQWISIFPFLISDPQIRTHVFRVQPSKADTYQNETILALPNFS